MRSITSLVQFKRGDHICIFYRDQHSLVQMLAHYFAAGLRNNERCFCVQKEPTAATMRTPELVVNWAWTLGQWVQM